MTENINIGGRLHSTATGNVVAGANEILDDTTGKKQSDINTETYRLVENINESLENLNPEQTEALSVATKANNNEVKLGYFECETESDIAAKIITNAAGYILSKGGSIKIKMINVNTASNVTLNINSTGAKTLYYNGELASPTNTWENNEIIEVYYDGNNYYANNIESGGKFVTGEKVKNVGIDDEPTSGSNNLVKSGGVQEECMDLEYMISDMDGHIITETYLSDSNFYHKRENFNTTGVHVGDTVSPSIESEGNNCFVIPCRKGSIIKSRTRYDAGSRWIVVDADFKVLQLAVSQGLVTTEQTIEVTENNAVYFIANHRGYQTYDDSWVRIQYSYTGTDRIGDLENSVAKTVRFTEQSLTTDQKKQANANLGINDVQFTNNGNANAVIKELYLTSIDPTHVTQLTVLYGTLTGSNKYRAKVTLLTTDGNYNAINQDYDTQAEALEALNGVLTGPKGSFCIVIDTEQLIAGNEYNYTNLSLYNRCKNIEFSPVILDYVSRTFILNNLIVGNVASWHGNSPFSFRNNLTYTISNTEIVVTNVGSAGYNIYKEDLPVVNGHLYYMSCNMQSNDSGDGMSIVQNGTVQTMIKHSGNGQYQFLSLTHRFESSVTGGCSFRLYNPATAGAKNTRIKFITLLDLSETFGEGKEPDIATVDAIISIYIDYAKLDSFEIKDLKREVDSLNAITGEEDTATSVVNPQMSGYDFATAINNKKSDYSTLCKCYSASFINLNPQVSLYENYEAINHNFRKDIAIKGKSIERLCADINKAFTEPIYRFCDAKLSATRNISLSTGMQADEPSAIVSDDGNTLYIYAHLKRISTVDGIHWTSPVNTPLSGDVTYIMHNNVNLIDGVYYMIGATANSGGDLCLFTSTDGLNFIYKGVLFEAGAQFGNNYSVANWGNTYLHKDHGSEKFYLYIEYQATGRFWEIALAMCTNILAENIDGTIGNWTYPSVNPVITHYPGAAGNPDLAKIGNEPLKVEGKYFMYFHGSTSDVSSNIYRAWSTDLVTWHDEGIIFDNRDEASDGNVSGNADHCIIEFKGRSYLFYTWDINNPNRLPYIKYTIDNRLLHELLVLRP